MHTKRWDFLQSCYHYRREYSILNLASEKTLFVVIDCLHYHFKFFLRLLEDSFILIRLGYFFCAVCMVQVKRGFGGKLMVEIRHYFVFESQPVHLLADTLFVPLINPLLVHSNAQTPGAQEEHQEERQTEADERRDRNA